MTPTLPHTRTAKLIQIVSRFSSVQPGQIEKDLKLLHLPDARTYLLSIVKSAAVRADTEQRFSEAILLYNLAEEYDSVVSVLNLELSNSLSKPSTSYVNQTGGSLDANKYFNKQEGGTIGMTAAAGSGQDVSEIAKSILEHYDRSSSMSSRVGRKRRETCEVLMRLRQAMGLYEQSNLEQALQVSALLTLLAAKVRTDSSLRCRLSNRLPSFLSLPTWSRSSERRKT